jgi:SAM-dependent methyltransferase
VEKTARRCTRGSSGGDTIQEDAYLPPVLANPGNLIKGIKVGGGMMGHPLAHENEAPYPQKLADWFIASHCPPGGIVLDPFCGSGTTVAAAVALGRQGIGLDLRLSQCDLARRRCTEIQPVMF